MSDIDDNRRRRIQVGTDLVNYEVRGLALDMKRKYLLKGKIADQMKIEEAYREFLNPNNRKPNT